MAIRLAIAEHAVQIRFRRNAGRQRQRLVAVVQMEPIVGREVQAQRRHPLVTAAGDMEERFAPIDQIGFGRIELPAQQHPAIELQQRIGFR